MGDPCLQMWYLLEKHCFHCSLDVLQDRAAVWGKSTMHFIFTVCEAAEENGIYSRIKVKVQEQLRVVEVKARRGQCCRGRSSHCPELAWTDFTPQVLVFNGKILIHNVGYGLVYGIYF